MALLTIPNDLSRNWSHTRLGLQPSLEAHLLKNVKNTGKHVARILALLGLCISAYLLWLKMTGRITFIAGCGAGSGCANVLGSRWSQFFLIPVSVFSTTLYVAILTLTVKPHRLLIQATAFLLFGAALWFMALQAILLKTFCPWCLTTHLIGIATGSTLLFSLEKRKSPEPIPALGIAAAGLLVLILGQIFGPTPDTHLMTNDGKNAPKSISISSLGAERLISFPGREEKIPLKDLPHLGPLDSSHILIKYFDYTCDSCRTMHDDLNEFQEIYRGKVTVVLLPVPLNSACNPYLSNRVKDHPNACELARLSLAVWRVRPDLFEQIHQELFSRPILNESAARQIIEAEISKVELEKALTDPWLTERLDAHSSSYFSLTMKTDRMPKLVFENGGVMHGTSKSTTDFIHFIGKALDL